VRLDRAAADLVELGVAQELLDAVLGCSSRSRPATWTAASATSLAAVEQNSLAASVPRRLREVGAMVAATAVGLSASRMASTLA
jgi:hypothetical protein